MARNIWDVSDILLQQRAGDIQGNMFANIGQQIGAGLQQYGEMKKQNKAMEGEIGSTIKFLESARDMVKNDPKRSSEIDQTLSQLHDPNVNLIQRYSMAKGAGDNIIKLVNLGEAAQKQELAAAQAKALNLQNAQNEWAQRLYMGAQQGGPESAPQGQIIPGISGMVNGQMVPVSPASGAPPAGGIQAQFAKQFGFAPQNANDLMQFQRLQTNQGKPAQPFQQAGLYKLPDGSIAPAVLDQTSGETKYLNHKTKKFEILPENAVPTTATIENPVAPTGYRWNADKTGFEVIPGSTQDVKQITANQLKIERANEELDNITNVIGTIDEALPKINKLTAGFGGVVLSQIPGTEAADVSELLDTIKANVGFDRLQRMRKMSPTGGALGQVAVQELERLEATRRSLKKAQSPQQLAENLAIVRDAYQKWGDAVRQSAEMGNEGVKPNAPADSVLTEAEKAELASLRKQFGKG